MLNPLRWSRVCSIFVPKTVSLVGAVATMQEITDARSRKLDVPQALVWVKDAPLFIDRLNLDRFYDAVVRPPFKENAPQKIKISQSQKEDLEKKFGGKTGLHIPAWLSPILSGSAELSAGVKSSSSSGNATETEITLEPISTPHRQLEQLIAFYLLEQPEQLLVGSVDSPLTWQSDGYCTRVPRALAFIDLPIDTKFVPMAAEFTSGKLVTFFDKLVAKNGERPPTFERSTQAEYWGWFSRNFDAAQALNELEKASTEHGRIEWIDYRVPLNDRSDTMHVHIEARGEYSTGTFAYRLIRRALGHGIRLVGTLKDGPDVNVLALYEK
jgi:hypothetical protein